MPAFIYDELATVGHPVALQLRQAQVSGLTAVWRRAILPAGHAGRGSLPARCDRKWFETTFCGGADCASVAEAGAECGGIWPHVTALMMYDPLALLAGASS